MLASTYIRITIKTILLRHKILFAGMIKFYQVRFCFDNIFFKVTKKYYTTFQNINLIVWLVS